MFKALAIGLHLFEGFSKAFSLFVRRRIGKPEPLQFSKESFTRGQSAHHAFLVDYEFIKRVSSFQIWFKEEFFYSPEYLRTRRWIVFRDVVAFHNSSEVNHALNLLVPILFDKFVGRSIASQFLNRFAGFHGQIQDRQRFDPKVGWDSRLWFGV